MMRCMSSAVAGLKAQQTGMDVIGNNIANVNTNGFKSSRTTYSDVYYQTVSTSTAGNSTGTVATAVTAGTIGGTNSSQIGYGATAASVDVNTSRNGYDSTSIATDCYIDGEGYFTIKDGANGYSYTRVGDFKFDSQGELVNSKGGLVCGDNNIAVSVTLGALSGVTAGSVSYASISAGAITTPAAIVIPNYTSYKDVKIGKDGIITGTYGGNVYELGKIAIANIPNPSGLTEEGGSSYKTNPGSGQADFYTAGNGATGLLQTSALETSNVDIANEFANMIVTQRGFQANSKIITVSDTMLEELCGMIR